MNDETEYYLDLDFLSEFCAIKNITTVKKINKEELPEDESQEEDDDFESETIQTAIDVFKYEIIKMCLERIMFSGASPDPERALLSKDNDEDSKAYNLAFNTLLAHKIIKTK